MTEKNRLPIRTPQIAETLTIRPPPRIPVRDNSRIDSSILALGDVARILHCTIDRARRIPLDQLPSAKGPGRSRLYLHGDVIDYVRSLRHQTSALDAEKIDAIRQQVLDSNSDSGRGRSAKRRAQ